MYQNKKYLAMFSKQIDRFFSSIMNRFRLRCVGIKFVCTILMIKTLSVTAVSLTKYVSLVELASLLNWIKAIAAVPHGPLSTYLMKIIYL